MNNIEDNPNGQEGLSGEPSPSEIINQMVDKLGELLHDHPNKNGNITINYYNSVGQRIDSVTTQNFSSDKWFKTSYSAPPDYTQHPAPEAVVRAIEKTAHKGLWFASTSWAVVYRVCQIKGYKKGFSQFGEERLLSILRNTHFNSSKQIVEALAEEAEKHRNGAEPNDDLTMMCIWVA